MRDFRKPSTICNAVSTPQDPFETSNENVPRACCADPRDWPDVLLNHRRERWFGQIAIAINARIYEKIDIVGLRPARGDSAWPSSRPDEGAL